MDVRVVLLIFAFISFEVVVDAELFFNRIHLTAEQLEELGLKCIPGHTIIRIEEKNNIQHSDSSEEETRRSHMNAEAKDETCKICVCSTEGKDEYCSQRPARNVNECIRMAILKKNMERNLPFAHERSLAFRIRRDYIWHYDEIPYDARASCKRSTSYYSNNVDANNTVIDVPSDIDSLLDYSDKDICYYCVCSPDGKHAGCISRDPWYCDYYRIIREPDAARNRYHDLFQQDRPAYFRQLSYRLRRTMDEGMVAFMDVVGDEGNDGKCIPFVSEYSDCTDANSCSGCNRCVCSAEGEWRCETVFDCAVNDDDSDRETISTALDVLYSELKNKGKKKHRNLVPPPPKPDDELIVPDISRYEEDFSTYLSRQKRSVQENVAENKNENHTIHFFHTIDDINEDTLKDTNKSGTIVARKVDINRIPKISRRSGLLNNFNKSDLSALHIEYNPHDYDHHITENKIEPVSLAEDSRPSKNQLHELMGNYTQNMKNEDLSKLVVNELKRGTEVIGDKNVSPMSNITFTPENDTLTAMTFIAGNLLNKLWDMEKESSESVEVETLKREKINNLLALFKEPLSIRQETFLKNALLKLSDTLNKNKNIKNVSLCETITDSDILSGYNLSESDFRNEKINKTNCNKERVKNKQEEGDKKEINNNVIQKLNNVISLMQKLEQVQKSLGDLKHPALSTPIHKINLDDTLSVDENSSINLFGSLLDRITELLIPNNVSKKVTSKLKRLNQFSAHDNIQKVLEDKFKMDLSQNNITIKDKIIFDYLTHIENNPNCLLSRHHKKKKETKINIEGNILYNLSEFFKIKSFIDLVKLTKPEKVSMEAVTTTESQRQATAPTDILRITANKVTSNGSQKLNITKEKLKNHLRAIIDDLLELQNEKDPKSKSNINILDALPCIYNILNSDKISKKPEFESEPLNKIKTLIDSLKLEFTSIAPTRRNNLITTERPKTAKVWERIVKNVNKQHKETRRSFDYKVPKTYEELKTLIEGVEGVSNSYKNFALLSVVPPQKRLMLLKTLEADTKQKTLALENIKNSIDTINKLPLDKQNEFKEFIENAENNIKLSIKVLQNLDRGNRMKNKKEMVEVFDPNKFEVKKQGLKSEIAPEFANFKSNNIILTRDQIVSRLIENRIKLYLASREATTDDLSDDINYNVGKRILSLLRQGNISVAKELFKVFIATKHENREKIDDTAHSMATNIVKQKGPLLLALREPLIRLDETAKKITLKSPELLLRQLLNLKNNNIK